MESIGIYLLKIRYHINSILVWNLSGNNNVNIASSASVLTDNPLLQTWMIKEEEKGQTLPKDEELPYDQDSCKGRRGGEEEEEDVLFRLWDEEKGRRSSPELRKGKKDQKKGCWGGGFSLTWLHFSDVT